MRSIQQPKGHKNNRRPTVFNILAALLLFVVYPLSVSSLPIIERRRSPLISALLGYGGHGSPGSRGGVAVGLGGLLHLRQPPSSLIHRSEMGQEVTDQKENTDRPWSGTFEPTEPGMQPNTAIQRDAAQK